MRSTNTLLAAMLALSVAVGCTGTTDDATSPATLTVALTDAASDDLASFCVDIDSIRLIRPGGATVGVLGEPLRIDLVTLTDVSQVLNVVRVPAGTYTRAEVTFDFTNAEAWLVGENAAATLVDGDGNLLTGSMTLPITVAGQLSATANRNRIFELDFDLDHSVRTNTGTNTVFVEPAVVLRVDRSDPKQMVVVGELESVDVGAQLLRVEVQTLSGQPVTDIAVSVSSTTVYQVDGVPASGATGLAALNALGAGAWVQLYGTVNVASASIAIQYIEAGAGTYNGGSDIVEGHVVERIGGAGAAATLTVLGHSTNAAHTVLQFNETFTISTDFAGTAVTYRGSPTALDTDAINVGQRVRVFGALTGTNMNATGGVSGVVRLQPTRLLGFALAAPSGGSFSVDLARVDLRDEVSFTWADGGATPPDPDALEIASGGLTSGLGVVMNSAVEVRGFFPPITDTDEDFVAVSVTNRDDAPSLLLIADRTGDMTVTPSVGASDLSLTLAGMPGVAEVAAVDRGFVGVTALPTVPDLTMQGSSGFGIYLLTQHSTHQTTLYLTYGGFLDGLSLELGQGADLYNVGALGQYDSGSNTMVSGLMVVVLD